MDRASAAKPVLSAPRYAHLLARAHTLTRIPSDTDHGLRKQGEVSHRVVLCSHRRRVVSTDGVWGG